MLLARRIDAIGRARSCGRFEVDTVAPAAGAELPAIQHVGDGACRIEKDPLARDLIKPDVGLTDGRRAGVAVPTLFCP